MEQYAICDLIVGGQTQYIGLFLMQHSLGRYFLVFQNMSESLVCLFGLRRVMHLYRTSDTMRMNGNQWDV